MQPINKKLFLTFALITFIASALFLTIPKQAVTQAQTNTPTTQLVITGLVQTSLNLTLADLKAMPQTSETAALYCVASPDTPLMQGLWTGVALSYLLQQANVSSGAVKVAFYATDGFSTDQPVETVLQNTQILVAYQLDSQTLGALRLVVPGQWGYKWINSLTQIELINYNYMGTYESQGYDDNGVAVATGPRPNIQNNQPYSAPTLTPTSPQPTNTPTQINTPQPTASAAPTNSTVNSNPKTQPLTLPFFLAAGFIAVAMVIVASVVFVIKKKKAS